MGGVEVTGLAEFAPVEHAEIGATIAMEEMSKVTDFEIFKDGPFFVGGGSRVIAT